VLLAVALFSLSLQGTDATDWILLLAFLLGSAGSSFFEPVVTSSIMSSVPKDRLGTASAFVAVGRQTAFAVGVTVAGAIFVIRERVYIAGLTDEGIVAEAARGEAIARAFGDTMLAGVVLATLAVAFSLAIGGRRKLPEDEGGG